MFHLNYSSSVFLSPLLAKTLESHSAVFVCAYTLVRPSEKTPKQNPVPSGLEIRVTFSHQLACLAHHPARSPLCACVTSQLFSPEQLLHTSETQPQVQTLKMSVFGRNSHVLL
ncbi:hypothetical protein PDJAM_G00028420 [Pangasius djambal]|uniref:Uncharacterized protein n=1 Tax=Pangasius djambal TaxID=1691987 RepID=A0ACC5YS34_9TELE|nr:hypothetical protein [Pangasius djambal]